MKNENRSESPPDPKETSHFLSGVQCWLNRHPHTRVLLALIGVVLLWRGIWALCDKILFPEHPLLSYSCSIGLGILILLIDDFKLKELH